VLRYIDAPDQIWSDKKEAAKWLGLTDSEFRAERERYPDLLPHSFMGDAHVWHWLDLVRYSMFRGIERTKEEATEKKK